MVKKILKKKIYGGIEGGGTKFRCVIGSDPDNIYASSEIDTKTLVNNSEFLSPIFLPKKPEMIEEIKGKKTIICSYVILTF